MLQRIVATTSMQQSRRHSFHLMQNKQPSSGSTAQLRSSPLQIPVSEFWIYFGLLCRWKQPIQVAACHITVSSCLVDVNGFERFSCFLWTGGGSLSFLLRRCLYFHVKSCCFVGLWIGTEAKGQPVTGRRAESIFSSGTKSVCVCDWGDGTCCNMRRASVNVLPLAQLL